MADEKSAGTKESGTTPDGSQMQWPMLTGASANAVYAAVSDGLGIARAIEAYEAAWAAEGVDAATLIQKSQSLAAAGDHAGADKVAQEALGLLHEGQARTRMLILRQIGDRAITRGDAYVGIQAYTARLQICEPLVASTPGNAFWVQDLATTHNGLGDLALLSGNLEPARASYEATLQLMERLSQFETSFDLLKRDMALLFGKVQLIGDRKTGDRSDVLSILDRLADRGLLRGEAGQTLAAAREALAKALSKPAEGGQP